MKKPKQASWRTLMRKASKTPSKDAAERLRKKAAALRRAERVKQRPSPPNWAHQSVIRTKTIEHADERVRELADKRLESERVPRESLERELVYRDLQLIDEFISEIANLRRFGPQPGCDPNHYLVPNSTIDAILKVLTRK